MPFRNGLIRSNIASYKMCIRDRYNSAIAKEYLSYLQQMAEEFQLENDIKVSTLSRYPEILTMEEQAPDEDELWSMLAQAIREACTQFTVARTSEGEHLKADLVEKLHHMASNVETVSYTHLHPSQEALERLEKEGCDIYCTKDCGQISILYRKGQWQIRQ